MIQIADLKTLREQISAWKKAGETIAFVPTMGNLHAGHISLVEEAHQHGTKVIVSIFVNPLQFGASEDLNKYPRTLEADAQALEAKSVDLLFTPTPDIMYPKGLEAQTSVHVPALSNIHCGKSRPGHFEGVATVVTKLFNLVQPDVACFGEKDFQQLQVIRTLTEDLCLPIRIVGVPTMREDSGLAMSSRNGYLSQQEKKQATSLYRALISMKAAIMEGEKNFEVLCEQAWKTLIDAGFERDYLTICDATSLADANHETTAFVILAAAKLGTTRLIDNIAFSR